MSKQQVPLLLAVLALFLGAIDASAEQAASPPGDASAAVAPPPPSLLSSTESALEPDGAPVLRDRSRVSWLSEDPGSGDQPQGAGGGGFGTCEPEDLGEPDVEAEDQFDVAPGGGEVGIFDGSLELITEIFKAPVGGRIENRLAATYRSDSVWVFDLSMSGPLYNWPWKPYGRTELGLGWRLSLGRIAFGGGSDETAIVTPDGTPHPLYRLGTAVSAERTDRDFGTEEYDYITRDGSFIRVVSDGSPCVPEFVIYSDDGSDASQTTYRAFFPDGTIIEYGHFVREHVPPDADFDAPGERVYHRAAWRRDLLGWYPTTIIDVFGNRIDVEYHDVPNAHVIRSIEDSVGRRIVTTLHENEPPERAMLNGLIHEVTHPVFSSGADVGSLGYRTAVTRFEYEQRPVLFPNRDWFSADDEDVFTEVALLTEIRMPSRIGADGSAVEEIVHRFDYNAHGELSHHFLPTGGLVTYRHDYWRGEHWQEYRWHYEWGTRGVDRRRTHVDGVESNSDPDNTYEWIYLRERRETDCTDGSPWQHRVRRRDPEGKWRHYTYVPYYITAAPAGFYPYRTEFLLDRVIIWDGAVDDDDFDDCWQPPPHVGVARLKEFKWEADLPYVPTGRCSGFSWGCIRDASYNPRVVQKKVTNEDGSWVRMDRCGWDGLGNFETEVLRASPGLTQATRVTRRSHLHVPCNSILSLPVHESVTEGGSRFETYRNFDVDGRPVEEVRRAAFVEVTEDPDDPLEAGYCRHPDDKPLLDFVNADFAVEWWLAEIENWPNRTPLGDMAVQCDGTLDPEPLPSCALVPATLPFAVGDVRVVNEYHGSACAPDAIQANGLPAWGEAAAVTTSGGDDGSSFTDRLEWSHGVVTKQSMDGVSWYAKDVDIDPATGLIVASRDPSGFEVRFERDALGRETRAAPAATDPPPATGASHEAPRTTVRHPNLREIDTSVRHDGQDADQGTDTYVTLDGIGREIRSERRLADGRLVAQVKSHDAFDRIVFQSEWVEAGADPRQPLGVVPGTTFSFAAEDGTPDPLGRIRRVTQADGATRTYQHDGLDVAETIHGINGIGDPSALEATTWLRRDARGRLVAVESPDSVDSPGVNARYEYDVGDRLVRAVLTAPDGTEQERTIRHDALGRLREVETPEAGRTLYLAYDALGSLLESEDAGGRTLVKRYDAAGRPTLVGVPAHPDGSVIPLTTMAYDEAGHGQHAVGKLTTVTSGVGAGAVQRLHYDGLSGRLSKVVTGIFNHQWETEYAHDTLGNVTTLSYPRKGTSPRLEVQWEYRHGMPVAAFRSDGLQYVTSARYDAAGGLAETTFGNGLVTRIEPDVRNRPSSIVIESAGEPVNAFWRSGRYVYDGAGHVVQVGSATELPPPHLAESYTYDEQGRLRGAEYSGAYDRSIEFRYDPWGNMTDRLTPVGSGAPCDEARGQLSFSGRQYRMGTGNAPAAHVTNRISVLGAECGVQDVAYDEVGNLTRAGAFEYEYDLLNRLTRTRKGGQDEVSWSYDGADHRILRTRDGGERTYYLRDQGGLLLSEWSDADTPAKHFVYFNGTLVTTIDDEDAGRLEWQHVDHLKSTRLSSNADGPLGGLQTYDTSPFGVALPSADGGFDDARFAGHERDDGTGLVYMQARYHGLSLGRFLTVDPGGDVDAERPQSWNPYLYARNDPIALVDPDGREVMLATRPLGFHRDGARYAFQHGFLYIRPTGENAKTWRQQKLLAADGNLYLGGFPGGDKNRYLVGKKNEGVDGLAPTTRRTIVDPPAGMTTEQFERLIVKKFDSYPNNRNYTMLPELTPGLDYNCNSLCLGVLESAGVDIWRRGPNGEQSIGERLSWSFILNTGSLDLVPIEVTPTQEATPEASPAGAQSQPEVTDTDGP